MVFPDPREKAILTIGGQDYSEWETVQVKHTLAAPPFLTFRMTCSEGQPIASNFQTMQIIPGDKASISLAGQLAFEGEVFSRQVLYDGTKHYIEIQGCAKDILRLSYSHVAHKTGEFNNKTPKEIITELVQQEGVKFLEEMGQLPTDKIPNYNVAPGTTIMEACETIIRSCGDAQFKTNLSGDLVAVINPSDVQGTVEEGVDILEGREIIYNGAIYSGVFSVGATSGNDQDWGYKAAQKFAQSNQAGTGGKGTQLIISEIPAFTKQSLLQRANMDRAFQNRDQVTVFVTVQGWLRPGGGLWEIYPKKLSVISPMLIMNGSEDLNVKSVTFTQDDSTGTRTIIEACNNVAWAPGPIGGP
jgi:prophage tail gpP-like protein